MDFYNVLTAYSTFVTAIGQIVAAVGVLVSIIYLARQLRDNTRSVQAQTFIAILTNNVHVMRPLYQDEDFAKLVLKGSSDPTSLSGTERFRWEAFLRTMFRQIDNVHHQAKIGAVDNEIWPGYERIFLYWLKQPGSGAWFKDNYTFFSKSLQEHYTSAIRPHID